MNNPTPVPALQSGRAAVDFYGALSAFANGGLRDEARRIFEERAAAADLPPKETPTEARLQAVRAVADTIPQWWFDQLYARVVAEELAPLSTFMAVEAGQFERTAENGLPVARNEDLDIPEYYEVNFHVSPWYSETPAYVMGPVTPNMSKVVARAGLAAVPKGSDILQQRSDVVAQATIEDVSLVLDMGAGGNGEFLARVQQRFPYAEMHGVDLSASLLRGPALKAEAIGASWVLSQQNAEKTAYDDDTFDLVTSYALLHEVPDFASRNILAEAFRVLRPGGELLMGDVPPYRQIPDWQFLLSDWETEGRVEPHWREAASLNRGDVCRELGFVDVEEYGIGPTDYPWVLRARKPAAQG